MKCRDFEDRLNYLLDERVEPAADARLADHAHECPPCRQLLDDQHVVLAMIKEAPLPATSSGFARRVVSRAAPLVGVRRQVLPRRIIWAIGTLLATAVAVLLAVSLVWQARQGALPFAGSSVAGNPAVENAERDQPIAPHRDRGSPPSGLALSQADWLIEAPRLPSRIRGGYRGTIDNLAVTLPETVQRLDNVEHYAPGIKPIRISLGVLLDTLWRALPGGSDDQRPARTSYHDVEMRHIA